MTEPKATNPDQMGVPLVLLKLLSGPTPPAEVKQRALLRKDRTPIMRDGKPMVLDYVDARYVMDTLDEICQPWNWQTAFQDTPGGMRCGIGILVLDTATDSSQWVWKWDAGTPSDIEPVKGSHSDAFKRAAVQWGIARDLYSNREDPVSAPEPERTVRDKAAATSRGERYEARASESHEDDGGGYVVSGAEERDPDVDGPTEDHYCSVHERPMQYKTGYNERKKKNWAGYFCPVRGCETDPIWVPVR